LFFSGLSREAEAVENLPNTASASLIWRLGTADAICNVIDGLYQLPWQELLSCELLAFPVVAATTADAAAAPAAEAQGRPTSSLKSRLFCQATTLVEQ
jgi:hypothetical protein